jgi:hypothetical protein
MAIAFLNMGTPEIILILIALVCVVAVGNYGKNTAFGYWGSVLLSLLTTPVVAFIVITFLKLGKTASLPY